MRVYLNGSYVAEDEAAIPIDDRGFLYGDALYESLRLYRGGFFRFSEHWQRLARGARALRIEAPPEDELREIAGRLVQSNGVDDGSLRITLTRGRGGAGLGTLGVGPPTLLVTLRSIPQARWRRAESGFTAIVASARRSPVGLPSSIKSANRLDAILARLEADEAGVDEAILVSAEGDVAEGTTSNVFWRTGDRLCTPALDIGILPGVTRLTVLEVCRELDVDVEEGRWAVDALREAEEIFLTMSSLGPVRVVQLDGTVLTPPAAPLFPRVHDAYWALVARETREDPVADRR